RCVRGEKVMSRTHCRATIATRSPGSQLKPLIFGVGFDLGIMTPATTIEDRPWAIHPPGGARYQPRNWWGSSYRGLQTARSAIHTSMNVLSVAALVDYVGIETNFAYMLNLGFTTLEGETTGGRAWSDRIPALALGGLTEGVILLELAAAYATVANQGVYNRPVFYTHVLDRNGNLFLESAHPPRQVFRRESAYLLTHTMVDTLHAAGATGHRQRFSNRSDIAIAGKTGTSQQTRDSGFVGFTPFLTGAVWLGYDTPRVMSGATGYRETLWRTIMERVHADFPARSFERPSGIVSASVCRDSGHPATDLCRTDPRGNRVVTEIFAQGNIPSTPCHIHGQFTICVNTGYLAGPNCHPYHVETRVGLVLPPLPDFAHNASIRYRHMAFSDAVAEGLECSYCDGFYHYSPDHDDPYEGGNYNEHGEDDDTGGWPWNIPFPFPTPTPDPGYDPYIPTSTPTPDPYDPYQPGNDIPDPLPPEEPYEPDSNEYSDYD
ncbi:MAG: penicillin-binding transpeptidase domain-containing protein, partial [Defluviitaleaceae bacterium]|nr:penicillin-binding transpeptidase domain-containing protein [Defluviitaleaceae bacterium]